MADSALTPELAERFASCALAAIVKQEPHCLQGVSVIDLHPAFYGCFDWHSAVHSHWLLVRLLRRDVCDAQTSVRIVAALNAHLTPAKIAAEADALSAGQLEYELPYGFAWLLTLCRELALCRHGSRIAVSDHALAWSTALEPLEHAVRARILHWAGTLPEPFRDGWHENSAFALCLALDYARSSCAPLEAPLVTAAYRWFGDDRVVEEPPPGECFLSPRLTEIAAMLSAMQAPHSTVGDALTWLCRKLSSSDLDGVMSPVAMCAPLYRLLQSVAEPVSGDPRLPYESHLIGLNFARAWCMRRIAHFLLQLEHLPMTSTSASVDASASDDASASPAALAAWLHACVARHIDASMPLVACGHWMGDHWTASFALLALDASETAFLSPSSLAFSSLSLSSSAPASQSICVWVQNMAGAQVSIDDIDAEASVAELKRRLHAVDADCVTWRTRLFVSEVSVDPDAPNAAPVVLLDHCTLASYGIRNVALVHAFVEPRVSGALIRTIGDVRDFNTRFSSPLAVCTSTTGDRILIADSRSHRVQVFDANGNFVSTIGKSGGGVGHIGQPMGVCCAGDLVFIADSMNHRVSAFHIATGAHVLSFGSMGGGSNGQMRFPVGVCVSESTSELFVSDCNNNRIQVFRTDGTHVRSFGTTGGGPGQLREPAGLCLLQDNDAPRALFVADCANNRIQVLDAATGAHLRTYGGAAAGGPGQYRSARGVCLSPDGELLFVADTGNARVQVVRASDGTHVRSFGSNGGGGGQYRHPSAVCWTPSGLLVVDAGNNRIQLVEP